MPASRHTADPDLAPSLGGRALGALVTVAGLFVVGVLMGGVYSLPGMRLLGTRPRSLTLALAGGLTATTVALGAAFGTSWFWVIVQWPLLAACLLLRHRSYGTLNGNFERFGLVHYFAIGLGGWVGILSRLHVLPVVL